MSLSFDPENPFPLLSPDAYSYAEAKFHASHADVFLGFQFLEEIGEWTSPAIGVNDPEAQESWSKLPIQTLQTPYVELRSALHAAGLQDSHLVIDLGCAYGRLAHVIGKHYPKSRFVGYEFVSERVHEAKRVLQKFAYKNAEIFEQDLADKNFSVPLADLYFIYDFGSTSAIEKAFDEIKQHSRKQHVQVIARGRRTRHLIHQNHAWLCEIAKPQHFQNFSIYSSTEE